MPTRDYIKEAEKNLVNICKVFDDAMQFVDALQLFGERYCNDYIGLPEFREGIQKIKRALNAEHANATRNCFMFVGVGGEEAKKYSKEMFVDAFDDSDIPMGIMHFLDKYGKHPSWYYDKDESAFRKQAKEKLKEKNKK